MKDVKSAIRWSNDMVMVFGYDGKQIPDLQDKYSPELEQRIRDRSNEWTEFAGFDGERKPDCRDVQKLREAEGFDKPKGPTLTEEFKKVAEEEAEYGCISAGGLYVRMYEAERDEAVKRLIQSARDLIASIDSSYSHTKACALETEAAITEVEKTIQNLIDLAKRPE